MLIGNLGAIPPEVAITNTNKSGGVTPSVGASGCDLVPADDIADHSGVIRCADMKAPWLSEKYSMLII